MSLCLVETIKCSIGELYAISDGRRHKLADCVPLIKVWATEFGIPALGKGSQVTERKMSIVLCDNDDNIDLKGYTDIKELVNISRFELTTKAWHRSGNYEVQLYIDDMKRADIEIYGDWSFELDAEQTKSLLGKLSM